METQDAKLSCVSTYAHKYQIPIMAAGDIFNTWHCGYDVTNSTIAILAKNRIYACYGQHELPEHDIGEKHRSPVTTLLLQNANSVVGYPAKYRYVHVETASWRIPVPKVPIVHARTVKVLLMHKTVYLDEKPFPDATGDVRVLIKKPKYQQYDIVITGDNHKAFTYRYGNTLWVNCGCLYRTKSNEKEYVPQFYVFYWSAKNKRVQVKAMPVPYDVNNVDESHLENEHEEKEWDSQFAKSLKRIKGKRPSSFIEDVSRAVLQVNTRGVDKFVSNFLDIDEDKKGKARK